MVGSLITEQVHLLGSVCPLTALDLGVAPVVRVHPKCLRHNSAKLRGCGEGDRDERQAPVRAAAARWACARRDSRGSRG